MPGLGSTPPEPVNASHMDGPRPSLSHPPSIWYAAVPRPHVKLGGNAPPYAYDVG